MQQGKKILSTIYTPKIIKTHLNQLKVDVLGLEVGNGHDCIDSNLGHLVVTLVDDLAAQSGLGSAHQVLSILKKIEF